MQQFQYYPSPPTIFVAGRNVPHASLAAGGLHPGVADHLRGLGHGRVEAEGPVEEHHVLSGGGCAALNGGDGKNMGKPLGKWWFNGI